MVRRLILAITGNEVRQGGAWGHEAGVGDSPEAKRNGGAHRARQPTTFDQRETSVRGQTGGH
jgi:hypothetical protein